MQVQIVSNLIVIAVFLLPTNCLGQSANSLFSSGSIFRDEENKEVKLSSFLGKTSIVTMSYTQCKKTCPMMTMATLKRLQAELEEKHQQAEFVIISYDPSNDTPEVLKKFKEKQNITKPNWHFLTGAEQDTRAVSKLLGLGDYWQMDDHILHGFRINIFSASGEPKRVLDWDHREVTDIF